MVQCSRCPPLGLNLRLPLWCGLGFGLSKGSLFYLLDTLVLGVITPFFLSIALSAAFWNFCPSRKGCSVTSSDGMRTMPSFSRNRFPLVTELFNEYVVRSFAVKRRSWIAAKVRYDQIDLLLGKRVERDAFLEYAPEFQMEAFDVRLL